MGGARGCQWYSGTTGAVCAGGWGPMGGTGLLLHSRSDPSPTVPITSIPGQMGREGAWARWCLPLDRFWLRRGRGVGGSQRIHAGEGAAGSNGPPTPPAWRLSSTDERCQRPLPASLTPALRNSPRPHRSAGDTLKSPCASPGVSGLMLFLIPSDN